MAASTCRNVIPGCAAWRRPGIHNPPADFGPLGIRVNAIAPGEIDTPILSPGTDKIVEQIPLHRLGTPDEVAKIIYVLCTETSSYLNGAEIHINGGQHV
jgi:NAD(P)-dependent dehydrogenase (short-subunit alcohol dehydrogenase family)